MSVRRSRALAAAGLCAVVWFTTAGPAAAHVSADKSEVPAGAFTSLDFTVPHGCEGSSTTALAIQIPEGILNAAPQVHPGWTIAVQQEPLTAPVESEGGETVTERPGVITFTATAGNALPDGFRDTFTIGFQAPDTPGETMFWKIVQTCEVGETAWIEEYDGTGEEPEHPAPAVAIVESSGDAHGGDHDAGASEEETTTTTAEDDEEAAGAVAESGEDDDDDATGFALAGMVAGSLGLVAGIVAVVRSGRRSTPAG